MTRKIHINASMAGSLDELVEQEKIELEVVTGEQGDVEVVQGDRRNECNLNTIYSGGWITCETACALAEKLKIPVRQVGKLLDYLDIKIRKCSLGCFE